MIELIEMLKIATGTESEEIAIAKGKFESQGFLKDLKEEFNNQLKEHG